MSPERHLLCRRKGLIAAAYGDRRRFLQSGALLMLAAMLPLGRATGALAARPLKIIAFGDSLTAGYMLPASAAFPAVLEKALWADGHDVAIVNAGVSGDTASGGLDRLDWTLAGGADGLILELGANDMLRGTDPNVTKAALDTMLSQLKARDIKVLLAGMKASPSLGKNYQTAFDAIYPALAQKYDVPLYPFFLDGVAGDPSLKLGDGMHPNQAGVERIVKGILPLVEAFLNGLS